MSISLEGCTAVEPVGKGGGAFHSLCSSAALETEIGPRAEPVSLNSAGLSQQALNLLLPVIEIASEKQRESTQIRKWKIRWQEQAKNISGITVNVNWG